MSLSAVALASARCRTALGPRRAAAGEASMRNPRRCLVANVAKRNRRHASVSFRVRCSAERREKRRRRSECRIANGACSRLSFLFDFCDVDISSLLTTRKFFPGPDLPLPAQNKKRLAFPRQKTQSSSSSSSSLPRGPPPRPPRQRKAAPTRTTATTRKSATAAAAGPPPPRPRARAAGATAAARTGRA